MGIPLGSLPYSGSVAALVKPAVGPQVCLWSHWSPNCHQDCSLQDAWVMGNVTEGGILSWLQTDTKLRPSRLQYVKLDINQERSAAGIGVQGSRAARRGDSRKAASLSKVTNYKVKMGRGEECCIPKPNPDTKGRLHSAHFYLWALLLPLHWQEHQGAVDSVVLCSFCCAVVLSCYPPFLLLPCKWATTCVVRLYAGWIQLSEKQCLKYKWRRR